MQQSEKLFSLAQQCIPGGVNSPVRAFGGVGGTPVFFESGEGAYLIDVDGRRYVDYVGSWGPLILGHAHPEVVRAIQKVVEKGLSFGAPTELEILLAQKITQLMPSIDMVRCVNSGTEATMSAIRLARGVTGRDKILKFEGCYHGHSDSLLVKAGSGALTFGVPSSLGVPQDLAQHTLTVSYNRLDEVEKIFEEVGDKIAAIIVEPVAGNMNCILPVPGFLKGLRDICDRYGSLLIFDEVITGFRVNPHGAQALYGIKPDLTTLGKIIGGGLPVGACGGRKELMEHIAPLGGVYQAGTLAGNPLAMTAGLVTLNEISQPGFHEKLEKFTRQLVEGLLARAKAAQVSLTINHIGSIFGLFFTEQSSVTYYEDVMACDTQRYKQFFHGMLREGIYFAPSAFEVALMSSAHGEKEITNTLLAAEKVFSELN